MVWTWFDSLGMPQLSDLFDPGCCVHVLKFSSLSSTFIRSSCIPTICVEFLFKIWAGLNPPHCSGKIWRRVRTSYFRLKNLLVQLCIFESAVAVSVAGSSSSRCFQYCRSIQCHLSYFGRGWAVGGVFAAFLIFWRLLID